MAMKEFLGALSSIGTSPYAFVGYALLLACWLIVVVRANRTREVLANIQHMPAKERLEAFKLQVQGVQLASGISPEQWLRARVHQYFLVAFLASLAAIIIVVTLAIVQASSKPDDSAEPIPTSTPGPLIESWFRTLDSLDYVAAWKMTSKSTHRRYQEEPFLSVFNEQHRPLAPVRSRKLYGLHALSTLPDGRRGTFNLYTYTTEFAAGERQENLTLVAEDGQWAIDDYNIVPAPK